MPRQSNIRIRRGTRSQWSSSNPVLDDGELGYDKTGTSVRIGDSVRSWAALPEAILSVSPSLHGDSTKTNHLILVSPLIDFRSVGDTSIFTVPEGHIFFIEEMEVVTTQIVSPGTAPQVRFGKLGSLGAFAATQSQSNGLFARHIFKTPQEGQLGSVTITLGVTIASTAVEHKGIGIVKGFMLPTTQISLGTTPQP
jgi:hypothetical protein